MRQPSVGIEDTLEVRVRLNGRTLTINTPVHDLVSQYGYNTKCNQCGRSGTPTTAGMKCGVCGICEGIMVPDNER